MIVRLSIVTSLMALFALSFSALVSADRAGHSHFATASQGCFEKGAVCVR
ncbi:hypothetical protein [Aureimonas sp. SK2]|nr:hypothetical protein [Aureimonas sp. SK2]